MLKERCILRNIYSAIFINDTRNEYCEKAAVSSFVRWLSWCWVTRSATCRRLLNYAGVRRVLSLTECLQHRRRWSIPSHNVLHSLSWLYGMRRLTSAMLVMCTHLLPLACIAMRNIQWKKTTVYYTMQNSQCMLRSAGGSDLKPAVSIKVASYGSVFQAWRIND